MARLTAVVLAGSLAVGCAQKQVSTVEEGEQKTMTTGWSSKDSRKVAKKMIDDMLSFPWRNDFMAAHGGTKPRLIVFDVQNKTHRQIAVETFINDIRRAVLRSGTAKFVAAPDLRKELRKERKTQDLHASEETRARMGQEYGADFALAGVITSTVTQSGDTRRVSYQVDLQLTNIESNELVWTGQKTITKKATGGDGWTL